MSTEVDMVDAVPMLDLKAQYKGIKSEIREAIDEVCDSQLFVMGPKVTEFESAAATYNQVKHAIGVSSGSDALLVALMALDIGPGDEVITSPFTFFATGGAISRLGATPIFCDVDPASFNLSTRAVERFIEERCDHQGDHLINKKSGGRVKVVMPVHLFGQTADMATLMPLARKHGLYVVEDAAQAIGAETSTGERAGSVGDIGCYSFFPSKNLGAFGDAGMCVTQNDEIAEKLRVLRVHGGKPKYYHSVIGGNFRLDALQAAILTVKLKYLDEWTTKRQANAARYNEIFVSNANRIGIPENVEGGRHIFNQYTIRVSKRDELRAYLASKNIGNDVYYPVPLHQQVCFSDLGYAAGAFPESESAAASVVSIPVNPDVTIAQQEYVARHVLEFLGT